MSDANDEVQGENDDVHDQPTEEGDSMARIRRNVAIFIAAAKLRSSCLGEQLLAADQHLQKSAFAVKRELDLQIQQTEEELNNAAATKRELDLISKLGGKGAMKAWEQLPERRKYEKDIILAVLCSPDFPESFLTWSWSPLRSIINRGPFKDDRDINLAYASAVPENKTLSYMPMPELLLGDLEYVRAATKACPEALSHLGIPPVAFDDEAVFRAFAGRKPVLMCYCLSYQGLQEILERFSERIRSNSEFMLDAAKIGLNVFPHIAGDLPNDKGFCLKLLEVMDWNWIHVKDGRRSDGTIRLNAFTYVSDALKADFEIVVAARERNFLDVSDLPEKFSKDPQFWKDAVTKCSLFWKDLPDTYKRDISFARCITSFHNLRFVMEVVKVHPELASDTEFWCDKILSNTNLLHPGSLAHLINSIDSDVVEIRNNRALMLLVCAHVPILPEDCLPRDFSFDREFVGVTVRNFSLTNALWFLPEEHQLRYPDLVALAISNCSDNLSGCEDLIAVELWSNLVVSQAWFENGGPVHYAIPLRLKEDPDYCMLIVEHCFRHAGEFVSANLKSNKDFMIRAVKKNRFAYLLADGDMKTDYDVTLESFGTSDSDGLALAIIKLDDDDTFAYLQSFLQKAQRKLQLRVGLSYFLFGMSGLSGDECQLSNLQYGHESTLVLKRRVAEYMGCPVGAEVCKLRRAGETLRGLLLWTAGRSSQV